MKTPLTIFFAALLTLAPLSALAQTDPATDPAVASSPAALAAPTAGTRLPSNQGIFTCNQTGAYAMSVGSLNAVGGSFVPVSDSAVTLNTGYLVYKACVLDPTVSTMVHAATASYTNAELQAFTTGNNGNPLFPRNYGQDYSAVRDQSFNSSFTSVTNALTPAFQQQVSVALARSNAQQTQSPYTSLTCPYTGTDFWGVMSADVMYPSCNPYNAFVLAQNQLNTNAAAAQYAWQTQLNWGNGIYPVLDANGNVVTPGILVGQVAGQAVLSGQQQLQNATSIGQMVGAAFAGIGNRILSGTLGGLANYTSTYAPQVTQEASQQLGQQVTNVALAILGPALTIEQQYNNTQNAMANSLLQAINQLRGSEKTCWNLIIQNVCSASSTPSSSGGGTSCVSTTGSTLHIATSTAFSQQIITSQLQPLSTAVTQNLQNSNQALTAINTLIGEVQNTSSADIQRSAISQLDQIVAQGLLHTQSDLTQANTQASTLSDSLTNAQTGLIPQTIHVWAGDDTTNNVSGAVPWDGSSSTAWCNASPSTPGGPATLQKWMQQWSGTSTP
jgi:hypothetical protein